MPQKFGRYEVVNTLGQGAMGVVYKAYDPHIDRMVALKVLRADRVTSEAFVERFVREARAIGRLSHPNIVNVFDVGEDQGTIYIAMEFVEGRPLSDLIREGRLSYEKILDLALQIAEALAYAHKKGIIHRDIKPSNILVSAEGKVKLTDFGIARIEDPSVTHHTQAGEILGTPAYMSPEQVMGRTPDGRSDIFSFGVVLYEMTTGQRPFSGNNLAAIFQSIIQHRPAEPNKLNPEVPEDLSSLIMKCLEKDPGDRFQDAEELVEALKGLRASTVAPVTTSKFGVPRFLIPLLIILILLGGGVFFLWQKNHSPPPATPVVEATSVLDVKSVPIGAQVFVDGEFKGRAPISLKLPAGKHEVRLTLADYYDWEAQLELRENEKVPLKVKLIPIE